MTKSEQREVTKAQRFAAAGYPDIAARSLAALHRGTSRRSQPAVAAAIEGDPAIRKHLEVMNGCYVEIGGCL